MLLQLLTKKTVQQLLHTSLAHLPPPPLTNLVSLDRAAFQHLLAQHCPDIDPELEALVLNLLERDPKKRPRDREAVDRIRAIRKRWQEDLGLV